MLIINLDSNKIQPYVETTQEYSFNIIEQITSKTTGTHEINRDLNLNNLYNVSIGLSPALREISQTQSLALSDEKFNKYVEKFPYEEENIKFSDTKTDIFTQTFNENKIKKTSVRKILDKSVRGLNEDFIIKYPPNPFGNAFDEKFMISARDTIYNEQTNRFEHSTAIELLYNMWDNLLSTLDYIQINWLLAKIEYPVDTDPHVFDYSIGFLDPFQLREKITFKLKHEDIVTGFKCDLSQLKSGYSLFLDENIIFNFINVQPELQKYTGFSEILTSKIKSNEEIDFFRKTVINLLVEKYPIYLKSINLNFVNKNIDKIEEFNDFKSINDEKADFITKNKLFFWDSINLPQSLNNLYPNLILNMKNNLINSKKYNIISDYETDSIVYKDIKE